MASILLTGGAGYIGSHIYVDLVKNGYDVVIIDNFSNSKKTVLANLELLCGRPVRCYAGDIADASLLAKILKTHKIEAVIHLAAYKSVLESTKEPLSYLTNNIANLYTLLHAMEAADIRNFVFSSSATVYGAAQITPTIENAPRKYTNPYAFTKLTSEQSLEQLMKADPRWKVGILRYFNPAGAHESGLIGEDPIDTPQNLFPYLAKVGTGRFKELSVFGNDYDTKDGTGIRDYIHIMDLARGHVQSLHKLMSQGRSHTVNLGTGIGYSVLEVVQSYEKACAKTIPITFKPRRAGDVAIYLADPGKAHQELGFKAHMTLDDMCQSSWHWECRRTNI